MIDFQQGDVVVLNPDAVADQGPSQRHYAIVVSNDEFNRRCNLRMVCPVTRSDNGYPFHVSIQYSVNDPTGRVLDITGFAQVEQTKTIDLIAHNASWVGTLSPVKRKRIIELLLACLL